MVQLNVTEERIANYLRRRSEELGDWFAYVEDVYEDLLADGRITSLESIYTVLEKVVRFVRWLKGKGVRPEQIDRKIIREYMIELRLKGFSATTIYTYVRALRRAFRVWGLNELVPSLRYPKVRLTYRLPPPEVVEEIIAEEKDLTYKTIIAILYETGMRLSECLTLRRDDVREEPEGYYRIRVTETKNGEERIVFLIRYAGLLRQYLIVNKPKDLLFPSPSNPSKPLAPRNVQRIFKRYSRKHGIKIHPHILRHIAATKLIREGTPERVVMKLLGHKTEKMMRIYVNLTAKDVEEAILSKYGIRKQQDNRSKEKIICPKCGAINPPGAKYCWRCGYPLTQASALSKESKKERIEEVIKEIRELLQKKPELMNQLLQA